MLPAAMGYSTPVVPVTGSGSMTGRAANPAGAAY